MHTYNVRIKLGSDAIEFLTNRVHVSPAIIEGLLMTKLVESIGLDGIDVLSVKHIDDPKLHLVTEPRQSYRPLIKVRDNGARLYVDEFPTLVGNAWEEAMDQYDHDVTAHLNEDVPCLRCKQLTNTEMTPNEYVPMCENGHEIFEPECLACNPDPLDLNTI